MKEWGTPVAIIVGAVILSMSHVFTTGQVLKIIISKSEAIAKQTEAIKAISENIGRYQFLEGGTRPGHSRQPMWHNLLNILEKF